MLIFFSPLQPTGTTQLPLNIIWQFNICYKTQWGKDRYCAGFNYLTIAFNRCCVFISLRTKMNALYSLDILLPKLFIPYRRSIVT